MSLFLSLALAWAEPEMIPEEDLDLKGRAAPAISLPTLSGEQFTLEEHRGKTVVLAFLASWCGPCRYELPALSILSEQRKDIQFVAVNVDKKSGPAKKFLRSIDDMKLPVVLDSQSMILGEYSVISMPTLFLIDKEGTVQFIKVGYSKEKGLIELEAEIEKLK